jgi:preprotein translocase subunit SecD
MIIGSKRFNLYLIAGLALVMACGCRTEAGKRKQQVSTLRLHLETNPDGSDRVETVPVFRAQPFQVTIEKAPFLTEANILDAKVINTVGGFSISIKYDRQGAWLLDQYTTANRGKHFVILCQWVPKPGGKLNEGRWLSAFHISERLKDGIFVFTPDASHEEAEQIVLGLNNVAKKLQKE